MLFTAQRLSDESGTALLVISRKLTAAVGDNVWVVGIDHVRRLDGDSGTERSRLRLLA